MENQSNPQKSISDELSQILSRLTVDQVRYVVARMDYPTKGEAAAAIGFKRDTVYRWPDDVERAVELMAADALESARAIRRRNLIKAMAVKVKGLDSDDEKIRQSAASELIEWELGRAAQPVTGAGGGALEIKTNDERYDAILGKLASIAAAANTDKVPGEPGE